MTALRNAVTATQTTFDIDTPLGIDAYPKAYAIESEVVDVVGGGRATSITVQRGIGGTTAAAHVNGSTLTAANAFAGGDSSVPDPTTGDDDDVVQVQSGAYVLAPGGGAITLRVEEAVVAFDDDLVAGAPFAVLGAGEELFSISAYLESAVTATQDDFVVAVFAGAEQVCLGVAPNTSFQTFSATIGQRPQQTLGVRAATLVVKKTAGATGTWTAGSLRFVALIGVAA